MKQKYFLRLPNPNNKDWRFEPVDVSRLYPGIINEVYQLERDLQSRVPQSGYVRCVGAEQQGNDTRWIAELVQNISTQICSTLEGLGQAGAKVKTEVIDALKLAEVVKAATAGQMGEVERLLTEMLYSLLSGCTTLADDLSKTGQLASGMEAAFLSEQTSKDEAKAVRDHLYGEWASAGKEIVSVVKRLNEIEADLGTCLKTIEGWSREVRETVNDDNEYIVRALAVLEGGEGFIIRAYLAAKRQEQPLETAAIEEAQLCLSCCHSQMEKAKSVWTELQALVKQEIAPKSELIANYCQQLTRATKRFHEIARLFSTQAPRPYEISLENLISWQEYGQAENILTDARWSVNESWGCKVRLDGLVTSAFGLAAEPPVFSPRVGYAISEAAKYLEPLRTSAEQPKLLTEKISVETESQRIRVEHLDNEQKAEPPARSATNADLANDLPQTGDRLQTIYELAICVALVTTCQASHFSLSTPRGLLKIILKLGLCTQQEYQQYKDRLREIIKDPSRCQVVPENKSAHKVWQSSKLPWLSLKVPKPGKRTLHRIKLSSGSKEMATGLMKKYDLSAEAIQTARKQLREEAQEKFNSSREPRPDDEEE